MSTTDTSVTTTESRPSSNSKNLIIGILVAGLLILGGFLIYDHNKTGATLQSDQTEIAK